MIVSANKNLQPEAKKLLEYLYENRGKKLVLGQHTQTVPQEELKAIKDMTGKLPALCGFELLGYSPNINWNDMDEVCRKEIVENQGTLKKIDEWHEMGGIVTLTWHWFSPLGGRDKSFFSANTDFDVEKAIVPGTDENKALLSDMDYMAGLLMTFADRHIPILWRPFHEAEGDWFWWGSKDKNPKIFKTLYRIMYDRYVNHFHLDNLIWVFNCTLADRYPGDEYVDVISRDMYPEPHDHTSHAEDLAVLKTFTTAPKVYAIGENGTMPDVEAILRDGVEWSYQMTWSHEFVCSEEFTTADVLRKYYELDGSVTLGNT